MKVLIACEFSGVVREAFRRRGHNAWSCDLLPSTNPHHLQCSVIDILRIGKGEWDLMIAHPPCTYLAVSGARWWKDRQSEQNQAINFFMRLVNCGIRRVAIENPIGIMSTIYEKPDQIIQPWQFGHGETKATCLWLSGLPKLRPTAIVEGRIPRVHHESPGIVNGMTRAQRRSITYAGIAEAMAEQWSI